MQQCDTSGARQNLLALLGDRKYYMDHLELYSLRDLLKIGTKPEPLLKELRGILKAYTKHITEDCRVRPPSPSHTATCRPCELTRARAPAQHCAARGHVCEACRHDRTATIIFPFQTGATQQCQACTSYFHSECYRKMQAHGTQCPKCERIASVRSKRRSAS